MLRLSIALRTAAAVAALSISAAALAQSGLGGRITDAGTKLDQDVQACRPVDLGEAQRLLHEAAVNKQRAAKAAKKGVPVDQAQVDADLANANALFNRAVAAHVGQCLRAAQQQAQPPPISMNLPAWAQDMLAAHNAARALFGVPPLRWNFELQAHATERAGQLAQLRQLAHAPRKGRGTERENILSSPIGYSPERMMKSWLDESRHFKPGLFPDVSDTGNWMDVAHYTQMVWSTTTEIGCGYAPGGGFNWLVCRYDPGGNKDGKPVVDHFIQARLVGGDYGQGHVPAVSDAANPTVINLLGDGFIYGNIDLMEAPLDFGANGQEHSSDAGLFVGYDLGAFRMEAEVAYKNADIETGTGSNHGNVDFTKSKNPKYCTAGLIGGIPFNFGMCPTPPPNVFGVDPILNPLPAEDTGVDTKVEQPTIGNQEVFKPAQPSEPLPDPL